MSYTRITTYRVEFDELFIESIEHLDEHERSIQYQSFDNWSEHLTQRTFNEEGLLIVEREFSEGNEVSRTEFSFDSKSRIINEKYYISNSLYKETEFQYLGTDFIKLVKEENEEIERWEKTGIDRNTELKIYTGKTLIEHQITRYNEEEDIETRTFLDGFGNTLGITKNRFDSNGFCVYEDQLNESGHSTFQVKMERDGEKIFNMVVKGETTSFIPVTIKQQFNEHGDPIQCIGTRPNGDIVSQSLWLYDEQNRLIEERGFQETNFNAIYGTMLKGESFHLKHKYETVEKIE